MALTSCFSAGKIQARVVPDHLEQSDHVILYTTHTQWMNTNIAGYATRKLPTLVVTSTDRVTCTVNETDNCDLGMRLPKTIPFFLGSFGNANNSTFVGPI